MAGYVWVWCWALNEAIGRYDKNIWYASGHSRMVSIALVLAVPFGSFVFALAVRPALVRTELKRTDWRAQQAQAAVAA